MINTGGKENYSFGVARVICAMLFMSEPTREWRMRIVLAMILAEREPKDIIHYLPNERWRQYLLEMHRTYMDNGEWRLHDGFQV
jgi:hypothetical protein